TCALPISSSSNASQYASSAQGSIEVYSSSTLSAGSSDTCYSRRTRKATAAFASHEENWFVFSRSHHPPLTRTNEVVDANFCTRTTIANGSKCKTSGGHTRRLLGEKRHRRDPAVRKHAEAHQPPPESVVYFRSG